MDADALERARQRIAAARAGRVDTARLESALERSRTRIEALAQAADDFRDQLPQQVGEAVQEGLRREVVPVARNLAELKGLINQALGRLERLEEEIVAERNARVDDLTVLVDLIASGWEGVDDRLRRIEHPGVNVVARPGASDAEAEAA